MPFAAIGPLRIASITGGIAHRMKIVVECETVARLRIYRSFELWRSSSLNNSVANQVPLAPYLCWRNE